MIDLTPAAERMSALLGALTDDQLGAPTPCPDSSLGDLADHIGTFALVFAAAARKEPGRTGGPPPVPSAANLEAGWRDRIAADLATLAAAWREPGAWQGMTTVAGLELPGEVAGLVAIDELVVHGWDVAAASDQPYDASIEEIEAAAAFVRSFDAPRDGALFGPEVAVPDTAPPLDRLLGLTGRDPAWSPQN